MSTGDVGGDVGEGWTGRGKRDPEETGFVEETAGLTLVDQAMVAKYHQGSYPHYDSIIRIQISLRLPAKTPSTFASRFSGRQKPATRGTSDGVLFFPRSVNVERPCVRKQGEVDTDETMTRPVMDPIFDLIRNQRGETIPVPSDIRP